MATPPIPSSLLDSFKGIVGGNEFFTGGLGLAAIGVSASVARRSVTLVQAMLRRHLLMTLEVTSKDPSYPWVLNWLNSQGRRTQHLSVNTSHVRASDGANNTMFEFVPGPGRHLMWYNQRAFLVERARETQMLNMATGVPWERVTLTAFGRDPSVYAKLLREAEAASTQQQEGTTVVYTSWGTEWRPFGHPRRKRPINSVVLAEGVSDELVADIQEWRESAAWYHDRGIPYRRGYLLHGPPGCGKTSFILSLAGHLDYSICILSLHEEGLTDDRLAQVDSPRIILRALCSSIRPSLLAVVMVTVSSPSSHVVVEPKSLQLLRALLPRPTAPPRPVTRPSVGGRCPLTPPRSDSRCPTRRSPPHRL